MRIHCRLARMRTLGALLIISIAIAQGAIIPSAQASFPAVSVPASETSPQAEGFGFGIYSGEGSIQDIGNLYVVTDANSPSFLKVIEKLPSGGFGRILRYRGWTRERGWTDLEFVYQDKENSVTLLDYASGKFFRTTFTGKRENPFSFFPSKDEKGWVGDWIAHQPVSSKFILTSREVRDWAFPKVHWLHSQSVGLSEEDVWSKRHARGPPQGGIAL